MLLAIILLSLSCNATESYELVGGGLTYHIMVPIRSRNFSNKVSEDGRLIDNPIIGIQRVVESRDYYTSLGAFTGANSVGDTILGMKYSTGARIEHWYLGIVLGAYEQPTHTFYDRNIVPFQLAKIGDVGIVPVVGWEVNYRINLSRSYYLKLNNIVSPMITNTTISVGVSF